MIQVDLRQVDLQGVIEAVKLQEFSDELCTYHTLPSLHNLLCLWILPMEARLTLLNLLLIINHLEYT